ncbi:Tyrosinase [Apiospora kogelbergensis]|uniref:Tyrosinase n=1 Tax=Apiospora kogelbergensis TaxID=1337665 RepID=UPI00313101E9
MHFATPILALASLASTANAAVVPAHLGSLASKDNQAQSACTSPAKRQEWRSLSSETRAEYMGAVKCLFTKPSRIGLKTSLYEDFPYIHSKLNTEIHFVAQFLPWHRLFLNMYEAALHECGYASPMPYWDWTQDAGALPASAVVQEFGGNGAGGGWSSPARPNPLTSCVTAGPLAGTTLTYYAGAERAHCLNRQLNNGTGGAKEALWGAADYAPANIARIVDGSPDFAAFADRLENGPHGAIHNAVGGDLVPSSSPNDPLFMLHHAQVDRLWARWQQAGGAARDVEFGGKRFDKSPATLQDVLPYMGLGPDMAIDKVMTTQNDVLCYTYV